MASFDPAREVCPHCHSRGNCSFHKTYPRYLVDFHQSRICSDVIRVTVVRCSSCGSYHSILPDVIIPYQSYSLPFILHVLSRYFQHHDTVSSICDRFDIAPPTLYRWKDLFLDHRSLWLGILDSQLQTPDLFLSYLQGSLSFSDFNSDFIHRFVFSFLQSHRMHSRRRPGGP